MMSVIQITDLNGNLCVSFLSAFDSKYGVIENQNSDSSLLAPEDLLLCPDRKTLVDR